MNFLHDTDSDDETINSISIDKIYKPKELNKLLLNKITTIANEYTEISIIGDINTFKKWRRSGCSFKITMDKESFECIAWEKDGLHPNNVESYINTQCIIRGFIDAKYFYSHKFVINVNSITLMNKDTKIKELKSICENKGYFENKKTLKWNSITKIGIISKKNTQGYDDFCNQFKVPIVINLEQITLEGEKTYKECIESIKKLQDLDLIIIVRGGGDTGEISNSFDCVELFDIMKKSNVPIITAIGHEQDKGDKLLITNVSDIDFPTPTALAKDLNKKLYEPLIQTVDNLLNSNEESFNVSLETENNKLYESLKCFLEDFLKSKFGGNIIEVNNDETHIIIKRDGKYYNNNLNFDNELKFTEEDINLKDDLLYALEEEDIDIININCNKLNIDTHKLSTNIHDNIKKIKQNNKLENKFEQTRSNKNKKYYLNKNYRTHSLNNLVKIKEILSWYKETIQESMDGTNNDAIKDIYNFLKYN